MSKAFKGKTCAYCAMEESSSTADHVFAREFLPVERRANLPKVPACARCNNEKSQLEHYLAAVMPFGGRHADALHVLQAMVPPRLAKNQRLHRELESGQTRGYLPEGDTFTAAMGLPFNSEKLAQLFSFIARGLARHHWNWTIPADHNVRSGMVVSVGEPFFEQLLAHNGDRVKGNIGEGAFIYEGLRNFEHPHLSIWKFTPYGGLKLSGDADQPGEVVSTVWVTTSRPGLGSLFEPDKD